MSTLPTAATTRSRCGAATQSLSTLISTGLKDPLGVAVDKAGDVYIADNGDKAIKVWNAATQSLGTLVAGLTNPQGVAVDAYGNVYIADSTDFYSPGAGDTIDEWNAATQAVRTLVSSGLTSPVGVAVDAAGNVYVADPGAGAVDEWNAATQTLAVLAPLNQPVAVAVDASGNVYIASSRADEVAEWNAAMQSLGVSVSSGVYSPSGVAVDSSGNVYIADSSGDAIMELSRAFVPGAISEGAAAGSDALSTVLPTGQPLTGLFAPASDQSWLTLDAAAGGIINFSFAQNTSAARTARISVLGQQVTLTQTGALAASAWPKAQPRAAIRMW